MEDTHDDIVMTTEGKLITPISDKDNTLINNFIHTMNYLVFIYNTGPEYADEVDKLLDKLKENKFIISIGETDDPGDFIITYSFEMIINDVTKLTTIINEFNDKIDYLRSSRYTGHQRVTRVR